MKLLRLGVWTVWFMLAWVSFAHAGPLIVAIGGILAKGGIAATLIKIAATVAFNAASTLIQRAIAKRQPQPGINGQLQVGGVRSFSFIVGGYATAGSLDYVGTWGRLGKTPNAYVTQVITLSDLPHASLSSRIFINKEVCTIDFAAVPAEQGYPITEYRRNGRDYMWVKFLDGSQEQADLFLLSKFGGDPERPWTADMIGYGTSLAILTTLVNRELLTSPPVARFEPSGLPLYDPRKDSTVGGSGAHRWGQPATYEPSSNPAVIIYNIFRGIHYEGHRLYGPGVAASRLPLNSWFAAMNECDVPTIVAVGIGGVPPVYEPQFSCGYEIKVQEHEPAAVIEELLKSCNGEIAEIGGIYKIRVGAPAFPVMFLRDEDFIVTDPQDLDPFKGLEATFNGATATYPEPQAAWDMKDAPQRLFPDLEAEDDGRQRLANFQFNAVSSPTQVQRLMISMVLDGRRVRMHRGTLPPSAFALEPLDTVSWTSDRNGYNDKLFTIPAKDEMVTVNQVTSMREVDPSDYDWQPSDKLPWVVGPINPRPPAPVPMAEFGAEPATVTDSTGAARRPGILARYAGDMDDMRAVRIEVQVKATSVTVHDIEYPYGDPSPDLKTRTISGSWCLPLTLYRVRAMFVAYGQVTALWSDWIDVLTPNVGIRRDEIDPTPAPPPGNLQILSVAFRQAVLGWERPNDLRVDHIEILYGETDTFEAAVSAGAFYGDTGLVSLPESGKLYYFWARSITLSGAPSAPVGPVSGMASDAPPAVPTGLAMTSVPDESRPGLSKVRATWDANTEADLVFYELQVRVGGANFEGTIVPINRHEFWVVSGTDIEAQVAAANLTRKSNFSAIEPHTAALDTVPPGVPTDPGAVAGIDAIWINWTPPSDADLAFIEILENSLDDPDTATVVASAFGRSFARTGLSLETTRFYWLRAVDTSGNRSELTEAVSATTGSVPEPMKVVIEGILFTPNSPAADRLSWTGGQISYGSGPSTAAIEAGDLPASTATRYIYWTPGATTLATTSAIATVYANSGIVLGIYKGGTDFQLVEGRAYMDGALILAQTIGANQLVTGEAVITGTAQIADAIISSAKVINLDALKIIAPTIESRNVLVGHINGALTKIEPGQILIGGAATLADWRMGGDVTRINGGMISANTVRANALEIGSRNITLTGIEFEHNAPAANRCSWTAGQVRYVNDAGNTVSATIAAGSTGVWSSGVMYIYWTKDDNTFQVTTSIATAFAVNNVVMATYQGGLRLDADYGRTIIDGASIKTGTIDANQIAANAIRAVHVQTDAIEARHMRAGSIEARHLVITGGGNGSIQPDTFLEDESVWLNPTQDTGGGTLQYLSNGHVNVNIGGKALRFQVNNASRQIHWGNHRWPIDTARGYLISLTWRRQTGDGSFYGAFRFYDYTGAVLAEYAGGWAGGQAATGNHYAPGNISGGTTAYRKATFTFGAGGVGNMPVNAKFMSFGVLVTGSAEASQYWLNELRIAEMTRGDLIVHGSIAAEHVNANSLFSVDAAISGTLTVGPNIAISGPLSRILITD